MRPAVESAIRLMISALFPAFLFLFLFLSSCKSNAPQTPAPRVTPTVIGAMAPDITVNDSKGHPVKLSGLRGNVVLINFWATWCGSCDEENPELNRLYRKFRKFPNFKLLSILYGDTRKNAGVYLTRRAWDWTVYTDPGGKAAAAYGLTGVPESYLVDKDGILQGKVIGPENWADPQVSAFIEKLLKQ